MRVKSEAQDQTKEDTRVLRIVIALQAWLAIATLVVVAWQELALPKAEDRVACLRQLRSAMPDAYSGGAWYSWWQPMVDQFYFSMASFLCETYSYFQVCDIGNELNSGLCRSRRSPFPRLRSLPPSPPWT